VAQIEFNEWTADDHLRQARFAGLRNDSKASIPAEPDAALFFNKPGLRSQGASSNGEKSTLRMTQPFKPMLYELLSSMCFRLV
jgi:ATP-dependent DNA ligase